MDPAGWPADVGARNRRSRLLPYPSRPRRPAALHHARSAPARPGRWAGSGDFVGVAAADPTQIGGRRRAGSGSHCGQFRRSPSTEIQLPRGRCCAPSFVSWRSCTAPKMSGSPPWSVRTSDAEWDWLKWLPHHQHPRLVDAAWAGQDDVPQPRRGDHRLQAA